MEIEDQWPPRERAIVAVGQVNQIVQAGRRRRSTLPRGRNDRELADLEPIDGDAERDGGQHHPTQPNRIRVDQEQAGNNFPIGRCSEVVGTRRVPSTGNGTRRVPTTETRPGRETGKLFSGLFLRGAQLPVRRAAAQ